MKAAECSACGNSNAEVIRGAYRFAESGLHNVVLLGIELIRCPQCGNQDPVLPRVNDLMRALATAVLKKPYRLRGEDVRFLRKYLRMTTVEFCPLLHVDKTTLSKWENDDDPIGEQSDRLIRAVTLALGEGLKDRIEEIVRAFGCIQETRREVRIEMDARTLSYQYA